MSASAFAHCAAQGEATRQGKARQGKAPHPCCSCSEISGDVGPRPWQLLILYGTFQVGPLEFPGIPAYHSGALHR